MSRVLVNERNQDSVSANGINSTVLLFTTIVQCTGANTGAWRMAVVGMTGSGSKS
jgi:hypothetical protein